MSALLQAPRIECHTPGGSANKHLFLTDLDRVPFETPYGASKSVRGSAQDMTPEGPCVAPKIPAAGRGPNLPQSPHNLYSVEKLNSEVWTAS